MCLNGKISALLCHRGRTEVVWHNLSLPSSALVSFSNMLSFLLKLQPTCKSISEVVLCTTVLTVGSKQRDCGWDLQLSENCVRRLPVVERSHLRRDGEQWADDWRQPCDLLLRENGLVTRRLLAHALLTLCPWAKAINLDSFSKYPAGEMKRDVEEW